MNFDWRRAATAVLGLALACGPLRADWDEGDSHKMHWPQLPDLGLTGIDVNCTSNEPFLLADDFLCTESGPITNIHIWGSWLADEVDRGATFVLSLHKDIPADPPLQPFSRPGDLVWLRIFTPGRYIERVYTNQIAEGWMNPPDKYQPPPADTICFQYNFPISLQEDPFIQESNTVYWLDVQYWPSGDAGETLFGWKTCQIEKRWNDNACWSPSIETGLPVPWAPLTYPPGHQFAGQPLDFAFVIDGGLAEPPEVLDFGDAPPPYPTLSAQNGARHTIAGPWLGPMDDVPDTDPDGQPHPLALGDDGDGNDDEDGVSFPGAPGRLLRGVSNYVKVEVSDAIGAGGFVQIWIDFNGNGAWEHPAEEVHNALLPAGIHYIAIAPPPAAATNQTFCRARISVQGGLQPTGLAADGEVEDHALAIRDPFPLDWCNLQRPPATTTTVGVATENIHGQLWVPGVTDQPGAGPGVTSQLGYGPPGSNPDGNPAWIWVAAAYNAAFAGDPPNDEYLATLTVPAPGVYDYCYRYTLNGVNWTYGDLNGSGDGYNPANAGQLTVLPRETRQCPKWEQPPDCATGVDLRSYGLMGEEPLPLHLVADDWLCDGRPITAIRWWGSYIGHPLPEPPEPERPAAFRLTWYEDIPAHESGTGYSMPGRAIESVIRTLAQAGDTNGLTGDVVERYYCTSDLGWMVPPQPQPVEHEYEYTCDLPEAWNEKEGSVYWLSVEALYLPHQLPELQYAWGWKTTHPEHNWNDDAVYENETTPGWQELTYPPQVDPWGAVENWPYAKESVNMSFTLFTDVCPRRAKKWAQPPDLWRGADSGSFAPDGRQWETGWPVRADDFVSDGRRITDLHWWGSYLGWRRDTSDGPVPPPSGVEAPIGFEIGWFTDVPTNAGQRFSMPGTLLTKRFVPIDKCHEVYYDTVEQTWNEQWEHEYQYYIDLLDPEIAEPWYETNGVIYWLSIQAVFPAGWDPAAGNHAGWGWLSTHPSNNWNDVSVVATNVAAGGVMAWEPGRYEPEKHPWRIEGYDLDLAFELTTDEVGTNRWTQPIVFHSIARLGSDGTAMTTVGDVGAGVQILQVTTNLVPTNWVSVVTNALPLAPPYTNMWQRTATGESRAFYRILQK